jgi:hypothetical protein
MWLPWLPAAWSARREGATGTLSNAARGGASEAVHHLAIGTSCEDLEPCAAPTTAGDLITISDVVSVVLERADDARCRLARRRHGVE